jgi:hypothetical protein
MAGINYGRVLLGGLAGGVVANACDFVSNTLLLADDMQQMAQRLSLDYDTLNSTSVMVTWIVVDFLYATIIAWTYAAIRPRLGPGPWTAMTAGLVIFAAVTVILFGFAQMGIFTMPTFVKATMLSTVTAVLTGLAAGKVYHEA